jgi:hypothetical protein
VRGTRSTAEKWISSLIPCLLIAFSSVLASPPPETIGRMNTRGMVSLNGIAAPDGSIVYAGNQISTDRSAAAYVSFAHGGKLVLGGSTIARVSEIGMDYTVMLDQGLIGAVSTSRAPIVIETHGVTIHGNPSGAAYQVEIEGKALRVLSRQGEIFVEDSNRTIEVDAGKVLEANVTPRISHSQKKKVLLAVLNGVAVAGTVAGFGLVVPSKSCETVSPSGLTCP